MRTGAKGVFLYLCLSPSICPSLSAVWSEGQLDGPRLFLSLILSAVKLKGSQQKICTGNCKSCPDNKKMKCFQLKTSWKSATSAVIPTVTVKDFPTVSYFKFCFLKDIKHKYNHVTPRGLLQPPFNILQHPGTCNVSQKQFVMNICKAEIDLLLTQQHIPNKAWLREEKDYRPRSHRLSDFEEQPLYVYLH